MATMEAAPVTDIEYENTIMQNPADTDLRAAEVLRSVENIVEQAVLPLPGAEARDAFIAWSKQRTYSFIRVSPEV